jgi:amino acid adenylation domain-containing protein
MIKGETAAMTAALGPAQWPIWAAYGTSIYDRRTRLRIRVPGSGRDDCSLARALRRLTDHDLLAMRLSDIDGIRLPMLSTTSGPAVHYTPSRPDETDTGAPFISVDTDRAYVEISMPSALADLRTLELIGDFAERALDDTAAESQPDTGLAYVDALEWVAQRIERDSPGTLDAAFRRLVCDSTDIAPPRYVSIALRDELSAAIARRSADSGESPDDIASAASLIVTNVIDPRPNGRTGRVLGGRPLDDFATLAGRLDVLAPVEVPVSGRDTLTDIARRTASARGMAEKEYQRDPLETVERAIQVAGSPGLSLAVAVLAGPQVCCLNADPGPWPLLLLWSADPAQRRLRYDRNMVSARQAERMQARLCQVLADPGRREPHVIDMAVTGTREQRWLRSQLTGSSATITEHDTIVTEIVAAARRDPSALAVVGAGRSLSYGELLARCSWLASRLRAEGVRTDEPVGLGADSLDDFVIGSMAIMTAGAAFLPLDLSWPAERLRRAAAGADVRVVLASSDVRSRWRYEAPIVDLGETGAADAAFLQDAAPPSAALAYVLHTSGSTGEPKATGIEHRQLAAYCRHIGQLMGVTARSSAATAASPAADLAYTTIFPLLAAGAMVVEVPDTCRLDADAFGDIISGQSVEILKIAPSHLDALLAGRSGARILPRRVLICGGERLPAALVERVRQERPSLLVMNHYGPTEATIGALVDVGAQAASGEVPIGRPLPHVSAEIRSGAGTWAPVGAVGDLYIGGAGVSRGYLNKPRLTAEFFVPALSGSPGSRVYDTGDRCVMGEDGRVTFRERRDDQVKIRGNRVEPGEVESVLASLPGVHTARVLAQATGSGVDLVGVVQADVNAASSARLLAQLRDRLPDVMVPRSLVIVERIPLQPNGKVDRTAVMALTQASSVSSRAPAGDLERVLAAVWCELLELPAIGATEDVFTTGAHSLIATQALSRIREAFDVEVEIADIFDYPTVAELAGRLLKLGNSSTLHRRAEVLCKVLDMPDDEIDALLQEG